MFNIEVKQDGDNGYRTSYRVYKTHPKTKDSEGKYTKQNKIFKVIPLNYVLEEEIPHEELKSNRVFWEKFNQGEYNTDTSKVEEFYYNHVKNFPLHLQGMFIKPDFYTQLNINRLAKQSQKIPYVAQNGYVFLRGIFLHHFSKNGKRFLGNGNTVKEQSLVEPIAAFYRMFYYKNERILNNTSYDYVEKFYPYKDYIYVKMLDITDQDNPEVIFYQLGYLEPNNNNNKSVELTGYYKFVSAITKGIATYKRYKGEDITFMGNVWSFSKNGVQYEFDYAEQSVEYVSDNQVKVDGQLISYENDFDIDEAREFGTHSYSENRPEIAEYQLNIIRKLTGFSKNGDDIVFNPTFRFNNYYQKCVENWNLTDEEAETCLNSFNAWDEYLDSLESDS